MATNLQSSSNNSNYLLIVDLIVYLREQKNLSYIGFLIKHRSIIVASTAPSDTHNRLNSSWYNRFLSNAEKLLDSNAFANLKRKVCILYFVKG